LQLERAQEVVILLKKKLGNQGDKKTKNSLT
jgi:hypothetical protein